ncbi:MAG: hypothetical protein JJE46_10310 [Acidimicrobiia bacterium]|nr:hypothetical protein [Acidimicrobiia bacterium]
MTGGGRADGKRALFSAAVRTPGTLVVECERCRGRARISYTEFVKRSLPVTAWLPWRHHTRYLRCPACEHRAFVAAEWFR